MRLPDDQRFWAKVDRRGPDECWPWKAGKTARGYGSFFIAGKAENAQRVAFYLTHGYWPVMGRHTCDNPPCCNPAHVIDGSHADNMQDMKERGRQFSLRGEAHCASKLTETDVVSIRRRLAAGEARTALAGEYRVSYMLISRIEKRQVWVHVAD